MSGVVEEVNTKLAEQPGLLNKSPEDQGWLCRIKIKDAAEVRLILFELSQNNSLKFVHIRSRS